MSSNFRVEAVREEDVPALASLIVPTFSHIPVEQIMGNLNTPEAIQAAGQRHLRAWQEHIAETGRPSSIKCVHTDPHTGKESLASCAQWYIYPKPRSPENVRRQNYLLTGDWVTVETGQQEKARAMLKPMVDGRVKWTSGRGHAIFQYMATDKAWRRQGAATACVEWGLQQCKELDIAAYLEASDEGFPVYKRLGFNTIEEIRMDIGGEIATFPAMMWWPPGTKEEEKVPLGQ